jgi:SAM-dependent methyltransferase
VVPSPPPGRTGPPESWRSGAPVPVRVAWAVDLLDVAPDDRILELGCGPGVAAALVASRLGQGQLVAIDRSAVAVSRTRARVAAHVEDGRVVVERVQAAGFGGPRASFDKAFAVNVNVFWTGEARPECEMLARVLRPGGVVHLVFGGPPGPSGRSRDVAPTVSANLSRHGFATSVTRDPAQGLIAVSGRLLP